MPFKKNDIGKRIAVDAGDTLSNVILLEGHRHLATERDDPLVDPSVHVVEDRESRVRVHLMDDVVGETHIAPIRSILCRRHPGEHE